MIKGMVVSGKYGEINVRQKHNTSIQIGELLIAEDKNNKFLLQAYDLRYGSLISATNNEMISGMELEEDNELFMMDKELRYYTLVDMKNLLTIQSNNIKVTKELPSVFSPVRSVQKQDLSFITAPKNPMYLGTLRSGSNAVDVDIFLPAKKALSHHILIPATTGRGKSNLTSVILWDLVDKSYCAQLVLDPHDEYYGRNGFGLKDHSKNTHVVYYSPNAIPGSRSLQIPLDIIVPKHFNGVFSWSAAQQEALYGYYATYKESWIPAILLGKPVEGFIENTLAVVRRRLQSLLELSVVHGEIKSKGIFVLAQNTVVNDITQHLEDAHTVIIDTSMFSGARELLIGSILSHAIYARYKQHKAKGTLHLQPVVSICLEEAPRVLGKAVLEQGPNIFSTIAREGRKFQIGLIAITQLPSLIPREVLANMNTKIILGLEMAPERQAIIESAAQDLSSDSRAIASLDKGEALVTSTFTKFAIPIKIPLFKEFAKPTMVDKKSYSGISLQ